MLIVLAEQLLYFSFKSCVTQAFVVVCVFPSFLEGHIYGSHPCQRRNASDV